MSHNRETPKQMTGGFAGGKPNANLGPGRDGFTDVPDRKPVFKKPPQGNVQVGRNVLSGGGRSGGGGKGKGRGRMQDYA